MVGLGMQLEMLFFANRLNSVMQTEADSDEVYAQIMLQPEANVSLPVLTIANMQMAHITFQCTILCPFHVAVYSTLLVQFHVPVYMYIH